MRTNAFIISALITFLSCLRTHAAPELIFTEADWETPNIIRIPFTLSGTLITVRGRIDSLEGNFFFDTGASKLLLNGRLFQRSGRFAPGASGVTGRVQVLGVLHIDTLQVDNLISTQLEAEILDLSHIERSKKINLAGILGCEVFEDFEVLFDYKAGRLTLIRLDTRGNPIDALPSWEYDPKGVFPLVTARHIVSVQLKFGLEGFEDAKQVVLAGSFNKWNEKDLVMRRTETGWYIEIPLAGGKHRYKFIVDGAWMTDPANRRMESDPKGNVNSVLFVR